MPLTLPAICVAVLCLLIVIWAKRARDRQEMELHSITPDALHALLSLNQEVLLFDVRQPFDLLAERNSHPWIRLRPPLSSAPFG
jgi:hypothetical protein